VAKLVRVSLALFEAAINPLAAAVSPDEARMTRFSQPHPFQGRALDSMTASTHSSRDQPPLQFSPPTGANRASRPTLSRPHPIALENASIIGSTGGYGPVDSSAEPHEMLAIIGNNVWNRGLRYLRLRIDRGT